MASHKNGNVPENSQNMPGQGLHIHVATETANAWMPKPQWACTGHMTLLCCRGTEAKASFITLLFFKAISFSIHGARHEAMSMPSDRVQPSLQRMFGLCKVCLCPSTPKTHSGQVPSGPLRLAHLGLWQWGLLPIQDTRVGSSSTTYQGPLETRGRWRPLGHGTRTDGR